MSSNRITLSEYKLATSNTYRNQLLGTRVAYTTRGDGIRMEGTITERPLGPGGLALAVTTDEGRWAGIGPNDTLEVLDA